ncbi:hypothetical protein [Inconstantimicrobium porci]|uniref:Uncharacterized protein n=1 Tax=Inconstantimicrobium porci TaxID=2652291 RepID=A0A7X2T121_9CLOT|nr:hypothetical protein [Inconstantimicrobium porci]MSR90765.1 hypothetical protein [Inconstantimicrobium porci]
MFDVRDFSELKELLANSCNGHPNIVDNIEDLTRGIAFYQIVFLDDRLNHFDENDWYNHIKEYETRTGMPYDGDAIDIKYDTRVRLSNSMLSDNFLCVTELIVGNGYEENYYDILMWIEDYARKKGYDGVRIDLSTNNESVNTIAQDCGYEYKELTVKNIVSNMINTGFVSKKPLVRYLV